MIQLNTAIIFQIFWGKKKVRNSQKYFKWLKGKSKGNGFEFEITGNNKWGLPVFQCLYTVFNKIIEWDIEIMFTHFIWACLDSVSAELISFLHAVNQQ